MAQPAPGAHPALQDLYDRVHLGLARGGALLHAHERALIDRLLGLDADAALLLARLVSRRGPAWRLPDLRAAGVQRVDAAVLALGAVGWVDHEVPLADQLRRATRDQLAAGCRRLGLLARGGRDQLAALIADHGAASWDDAPWIRVREAPLWLRLSRWATLQVHPDASVPVLDRLGVVRWYSYAPTSGGILPDRAAWDAWEEVLVGLEAPEPARLVSWLDHDRWPPGGLDLRRRIGELGLELAASMRRQGDAEGADALLAALAARPGRWQADAVVERVRGLARSGRHAEARSFVRAAGLDDAAARRAVERSLRRLPGVGLPPMAPLRSAAERTVRLPLAASEGRARPRFGAEADTVEAAVIRLLAQAGRRALFAEGPLWRTVLGLLFADVMFTPVEEQLPVPFLSAPLDWGTPAFAARRRAAVDAVWADVLAGRAAERVREAADRLAGTVIRGVRWDLASRDELVAVVASIPGPALRALLEPLLDHGSRAARGLPDLIVLPGAAVRLDQAFPAQLPAVPWFIEVKTANDALRDAQAVWHDRLIASGLVVERWLVAAPPAGQPPAGQPRSASFEAA